MNWENDRGRQSTVHIGFLIFDTIGASVPWDVRS